MPLTLGTARYQLQLKSQWRNIAPEELDGIINEACEVLLTETKPKDCIDRIGVTVYSPAAGSSAILTLPREYLMAEGILRDKSPVQIRNGWFEFSLAGRGSSLAADDTVLTGESIDMGDGYCCIREPVDVNAAGCRLKIYTDASATSETDEAIMQFMGLNANGDVIRTTTGTTIRNGEAVNLVAATATNVTTTNSFARLTRVVKPNTNGIITVYAIDPDDSSEHLIATYQPSEKLPNYRRYMVPTDPDGTASYTSTVLARKRFVLAEQDNDNLSIDNFSALVDGCLYVVYRDSNDDERAGRALARAVSSLSKQAVRARPASQYPPPVVNMDEIEHRTFQGY
jgi:hypothetical protein